jgi:hypothetical protein
LLKEELEGNDRRIFNFLKVGENNKLFFDFKDSKQVEVQLREKT